MNELKIDLSSESYLDKVLNEKEKISNNVIIFIKKDVIKKELIEKRLTKLLKELSDKNREIIIENNDQVYHISLNAINFKKIIVKDLVKEEKIVFINLNSINLSTKKRLYEISDLKCEKIEVENQEIRSIIFKKVKVEKIFF